MKRTNLGGPVDSLALGTDHAYVFRILNATETAAIDISGWALSYRVKRSLDDLDASALITKTTGGSGVAISGTYAADPTDNTQVATVTVTDSDTDGLDAGAAVYELKRTDAGSETILAYGSLQLLRAVHRT